MSIQSYFSLDYSGFCWMLLAKSQTFPAGSLVYPMNSLLSLWILWLSRFETVGIPDFEVCACGLIILIHRKSRRVLTVNMDALDIEQNRQGTRWNARKLTSFRRGSPRIARRTPCTDGTRLWAEMKKPRIPFSTHDFLLRCSYLQSASTQLNLEEAQQICCEWQNQFFLPLAERGASKWRRELPDAILSQYFNRVNNIKQRLV